MLAPVRTKIDRQMDGQTHEKIDRKANQFNNFLNMLQSVKKNNINQCIYGFIILEIFKRILKISIYLLFAFSFLTLTVHP